MMTQEGSTRRRIVLGVAIVLGVLAGVVWRMNRAGRLDEPPYEPGGTNRVEWAPRCPWRDPERDVAAWFPGATRWDTETRILSGQRVELTRELGRAPVAEEHALVCHGVYQPSPARVGTVMTRRLKGEHGAIEIVVATDVQGRIVGVRLQRLREPEPIARQLTDGLWISAFQGRTAAGSWDPDRAFPALNPDARACGRSIIEGVRSLMILLAAAERPGVPIDSEPHVH